jgi:outer membrane protein OmpA-like peptidoglycan-associated protein
LGAPARPAPGETHGLREEEGAAMVRTIVIGGLLGGALLVTGCATKKYVQEEVAKSQERVGGEVGRVDRLLGEEKARVDGLQKDLGATKAATDDAARKASEAATLAGQAQSRADEAGTKAADAAARADAAGATAKEALAKASDTDQRLTKLWASKDKRTLTETLVVQFDFDKWVLDDGAQTRLLALVKQLEEQPQLSVELEGYTDSTGAGAYNIGLSQRRAEAVRRFLVEKGVGLPRIHSIGLGDIRPVADNKTKQGRDQNRRVSIRLYAPAE